MEDDDENNKWLCGLNYATKLGFTHAEYEEAIKLIKTPDVANANQLLVALIDVSIRDNTASTPTNLSANENIVTSTISNNNINVNASTCCASSNQSAANVVRTGFAATSIAQPQTSTVDAMVTSSSAQSQGGKSSLPTLTSSSCYSSITSFPTSSASSSSDQSLESLQQATLTLRKVYIDGSNVARSHRRDATFSWLGIKLCVDWFVTRGHRVKVFVPRDKCQQTDESIWSYLNDLDALVQTPNGCNDDLFIIKAARHFDGVIVSNDLFRDEKRFDNEMQHFIHLHRLPYVFDDDLFIPAPDPLGKTGPTLDEFLIDSPEQLAQINHHHCKTSRTKSHQKYQFTKNNYSMKQQPNHGAYHQSNLLTRSLPIGQSPTMVNDSNPHTRMPTLSGQHPSQFQNHYHQQPKQLKIHQQVRRKVHNHGHQRQQVSRSVTVACANPSGVTKDSETHVVSYRTKSHNI